MTTSSPGRISTSRGCACGQRAVRHRRRRSFRSSAVPRRARASSCSSASATSRSVRPDQALVDQLLERGIGKRRTPHRSRATSSASLTARRRSTSPHGATSSTRASELALAVARAGGPTCGLPRTRAALIPGGTRSVDHLERRPADGDARRRVDLCRGLLDVAKVGDEGPRPVADQRDPVGAACSPSGSAR